MKVQSQRARVNEDPFSLLHPDVFELIFQHFSGKDVLNSSEVSQSWFEVIEISAKCGEKLCLQLSLTSVQDVLSQRKYQNLTLRHLSINSNVLNVIKGRDWKKVIIKEVDFNTRSDFDKFLDTIEKTVEVLRVERSDFKFAIHQNGDKKFKFPNLTQLHLTSDEELLNGEAFMACTTLKNFIFEIDGVHRQTLEKILTNNQKLEYLQIRNVDDWSRPIFRRESLNDFRFQLKEFGYSGNARSLVDVGDSLFVFLQSQADTLEKLWLQLISAKIIQLVLKMPNMSELYFISCFQDDWDNLQLVQSLSMTNLNFSCNDRQINFFTALLDAMPNLKILKFSSLTNHNLPLIASRCRNLEELKVLRFFATRIDDPSFFPHIKRVHCLGIKNRIKQRIEAKARDERTSFEQAVLEAEENF